jgi:acyl-coenzyme A thioesterase PaaI-like protein
VTQWKNTLALWGFGLTKIPLIAFVRPSVIHIDGKGCEIKIPLNYFTKNHLGSMYFGVLAVGADLAGGLMAMEMIRRSKRKVQLVFKDYKANFLKRPEADVHFICHDGEKVQHQVAEAIKTKKRITRPLKIIATVPKLSGAEPVAEFELGLSLKLKQT